MADQGSSFWAQPSQGGPELQKRVGICYVDEAIHEGRGDLIESSRGLAEDVERPRCHIGVQRFTQVGDRPLGHEPGVVA